MVSEKMKKLISNNSVIREMFEEGKRLKKIYGEDDVYDFSLGNPSVDSPKEIKENIINVLENTSSNELHGYMSNSGFEDVRKKIAKSINEKFLTDFTYENIVMTAGAASGLNIVLKSILNRDDEVIVFAPYFSEYNNYIENYDGVVRIVKCNEEDFYPDLQEFENVITNKTKAVIINSPNNPTGVIYSEDFIKRLSEIMNKKQEEYSCEIYLISDEPYREIVYGNRDVPYVTQYYNNSFVVYSYSKSLSLPGERIGYVAISNLMNNSDEMIAAITISNRIIGVVNAPSLMQKVIGNSLDLKVNINQYEKNKDCLIDIIKNETDFKFVEPQGAFYLFLKTPIDDKEFCKIAKKFNILFVPASSFAYPGYVRIAYCVDYNMIEKSRNSFRKLNDELNKI